MGLTPADVHNQQFTTVRMRTGYDMDEVDAFLDAVEAEIGRLLAENDDLRAQVTQAQSRALAAEQRAAGAKEDRAGGAKEDRAGGAKEERPQPDSAPVNPALAAVVAQASPSPDSADGVDGVLEKTMQVDVVAMDGGEGVEVVAEVVADAVVTADGAGSSVEQAPPSEQALKILEIAQRTADETVAHAKSEASSILTKARSQAAEVTRDLDAQRTALEKQVGQLRTFERNYRIALRDHIAGQLAEFDRAATKEDSVVGPTPAIESVQAALDD